MDFLYKLRCYFGSSAEVVWTLVGYEIPGLMEGGDHSLFQRTLVCSGQVLLKLLHT